MFAGQSPDTDFLPRIAERFTRQRLLALAKVEGKLLLDRPVVLFVCTTNAGLSQMAQGWFTHLAGDGAIGWSGGSEPARHVDPVSVTSMAEVGIDITEEYPKPWTDEILRAADTIITIGSGETFPIHHGRCHQHWDLPGLDGQPTEVVRSIRDEIQRLVRGLVTTLDVSP